MSDVFISHSSKDKEIADMVVRYLEERGLTCWIAPRDIVPGSEWAASISTAITASKICLLIYSENSAASSQVARELSIAEAKSGVYLVPYKIDDTPLTGTFEYFLTGSHWITANCRKKDYKLEELYLMVAGITGKAVQNITNNTYIDNLHIHAGDNVQEAVRAAESISQGICETPPGGMPAAAPAQAADTSDEGAAKNSGALRGRLKYILAAVIAVVGVIAIVLAVAFRRPANAGDKAMLTHFSSKKDSIPGFTHTVSETVLGNSAQNIRNGGIICAIDDVYFYIDNSCHTISTGEGVLFADQDAVYSNLCYVDGTLYYLKDKKAYSISEGQRYSLPVPGLETYSKSGISRLYITDKYFFIFSESQKCVQQIERATGSLKDTCTNISVAADFYIYKDYLYYISQSKDGLYGFFRCSIEDIGGNGYGFQMPEGAVMSSPAAKGSSAYALFNEIAMGKAGYFANFYNGITDLNATYDYALGDAVSLATDRLENLCLDGNNVFFTVNRNEITNLYHLNTSSVSEECVAEGLSPNIMYHDNGNLSVYYMRKSADAGGSVIYNIKEVQYTSDGSYVVS